MGPHLFQKKEAVLKTLLLNVEAIATKLRDFLDFQDLHSFGAPKN
jgi:hypothetical protein